MAPNTHPHHWLLWLVAASFAVLGALLVPAPAHGVATALGPLPKGAQIRGNAGALDRLTWDFDCQGAFSVVVTGAAPGRLTASVTIARGSAHPGVSLLWAGRALVLPVAGDYRLKLSPPGHATRMAYVDQPARTVVRVTVTYASRLGAMRITFPVPSRALRDVRSDAGWHGSGLARAHPSTP